MSVHFSVWWSLSVYLPVCLFVCLLIHSRLLILLFIIGLNYFFFLFVFLAAVVSSLQCNGLVICHINWKDLSLKNLCVFFSVLCPSGHSSSSSAEDSLVVADTSEFFKFWQLQHTVPFFLIIILFPLCSVKSPTFFTKFNSLGELSTKFCN